MADEKSFNLPQAEEKILEFWKENKIFEKSLENRKSGKRPFVFYEGPPYANGKPGIHHVLARVYKDIILRYKAMQGYYVPRKAGWDTHGLPVEIAAEKALGLKSKKDIEKFGIERFNEEAQKAVWIYKDEWENLTRRIGYWLDLKNAYITCSSDYVETLWWVLAKISKRGLLYKAHKVVPWCPRCGTALSSHELAQGYKKVEDQSVYVKFKVILEGDTKGLNLPPNINTFLLSWTTTPWTLPGNVALAVNPKIKYGVYEQNNEAFIIAAEKAKDLGFEKPRVTFPGSQLRNVQYVPLFNIPAMNSDKSFKVYGAGFVTAEDGTGIVHTAVMYGEDDYLLGKVNGLPQHHTVGEDGKFTKEVKGFEGLYVKSKETEEKIFEYLKKNNSLFKTETYKHEYPFCWRCGSAILYYARTSWFIAMSRLRKELLKSNATINWVPPHVKEGRFGEWLKEAKDWNLSRERYWGTPMPVWECAKCGETEVIGSLDELSKRAGGSKNKYWVIRHGESETQLKKVIDSGQKKYHLTTIGRDEVARSAAKLKRQRIDMIITSDIPRTMETARIAASVLGVKKIIVEKGLREIMLGTLTGRSDSEYHKIFPTFESKFENRPEKGESLRDLRSRLYALMESVEKKYNGKKILLVSHEYPIWMLFHIALGWNEKQAIKEKEARGDDFINPAEVQELEWKVIPRDGTGEVDLHRPYADKISFNCKKCKGKMERIREVADVWFDSGAMPFAQVHYPFEPEPQTNADLTLTNAEKIQRVSASDMRPSALKDYPADYISEAMDQTRGWFYTLISVATALGYEAPYKNVISLGLINDKFGQKMSKSKGNIVDPWKVMNDYGVDAVRWYFYTATPPGEPKNFDENEIAKTYRKFHLILWNSVMFYQTYADKRGLETRISADKTGKSQRRSALSQRESANILDKWVLARLNETIDEATANLEKYQVREAAFAIENFLDDLSRWYIRRSRRRFSVVFKAGATAKDEKDYLAASQTLGFALSELDKLVAPFTPFFGEIVHKELGVQNLELRKESVHLEDWPKINSKLQTPSSKLLINEMAEIRKLGSLALAKRAELGIKVRQPLALLKVKSAKPKNKEVIEILKDEVNVKKIVFDAKAKIDVEFDTIITPELKGEGIVRDLVRIVQELRQKAGLKPGENIELMLDLPAELKSIVSKNEKLLKTEVAAKKLDYKKSVKLGAEIETKIDGIPVWIGIKGI
ncbi:MAG TPA: class I tRNA ligase family protein [Candidatus Paceibacterota bacterium]|nr:class I tRNA ligase family protein [Candidatus Paceibacterota bacterium]